MTTSPGAGPAVLVIAGALAPRSPESPLQAWLGPDRSRRLSAALLRRAARWAAATAPDAAYVAHTPEDAPDDLADLLPPGVRNFPQIEGPAHERVEAAARRVFELESRALIIVKTDMPALADYHARAACADLGEGCAAVLGVAIGGGLYLLGLESPQPELLALVAGTHDGETTRQYARRVTAGLGLEVGMLHYERALAGPADAHAMLADPLLAADIAAALRE